MKREFCENCRQEYATKSAYGLAVCDECFVDLCGQLEDDRDEEYSEELNFDVEIEEVD